jgi:hypothetical protein
VLLLARHFDQQFRDLGAIQQDFAAFVRSAGIDSGERFKHRMSSPDIHLMLKANVGALSYVGNVTLFDSDGVLLNSSGAWPVPERGRPALFQSLQDRSESAGRAGRTGPQPHLRRLDHRGCAQARGAERRIPGHHRARFRAGQFRKVLRLRRARHRRFDLDDPSQRDAVRPLPA